MSHDRELRVDMSKSQAIKNEVFFIFHYINLTNPRDSIIPQIIVSRAQLGYISNLMRTTSYPNNVHFLLGDGEHREIILVIKSGFDHLHIIS